MENAQIFRIHARTFENIAKRLNFSAEKCKKPHYLRINIGREVAQATRLTIELIREKAFGFLVTKEEGGVFKLDSLKAFFEAGKGNSDNENAYWYFEMAIIPALRKMHPKRLKENCGSFGWSQILKDKNGKLVYKNGKLLKATRYGDRIDSLDNTAQLEAYRTQALDYADVCQLLRDLLKEQLPEKPEETESKTKAGKKAKTKKRRKRKIKITDEQRNIWQQIKDGATVAELADEKNCSNSNIRQQYAKAEKKLKKSNAGSRSINFREKQRLPTDKRGQETVEDNG